MAEYERPCYPALAVADASAKDVLTAIADLGFRRAEDLSADGCAGSIHATLHRWRVPETPVAFYWLGHGQCHDHRYYLIGRDTPGRPNNVNALRVETLGQLLADSTRGYVLTILDSCYSGGGAVELAAAFASAAADQVGALRWPRAISVIASASAGEIARERTFSQALRSVITQGPPDGPESVLCWGPRDRYLSADELCLAVQHVMAANGRDQGFLQTPDYAQRGVIGRFLRNPRYDPQTPDQCLDGTRQQPTATTLSSALREATGDPTQRSLLAALAWAEGNGLPGPGVWLAVARALASPDLNPTVADLVRLVSEHGRLVLRSQENGRTVHRLADDGLAFELRRGTLAGGDRTRSDRAGPIGEREVQARIVASLQSLTDGVPAEALPVFESYLADHLPGHAARAGQVPTVVATATALDAVMPSTGPVTRLRDRLQVVIYDCTVGLRGPDRRRGLTWLAAPVTLGPAAGAQPLRTGVRIELPGGGLVELRVYPGTASGRPLEARCSVRVEGPDVPFAGLAVRASDQPQGRWTATHPPRPTPATFEVHLAAGRSTVLEIRTQTRSAPDRSMRTVRLEIDTWTPPNQETP